VTILNLQVLSIPLFYLAPGVVATTVYSYLIPSERKKLADYLVELVTFSMFYLALFFWLVALLYQKSVQSNVWLFQLLVLLTVFVIPAFLGWFASYLLQARWLRRFVKLVIHPVPMSWDYIFSRNKSYWVKFYLKTGEKFGGYYSTKSFASSYPDPQEIYVEQVWRLNENDALIEMVVSTAGGFVKADDCKFIEFLEIKEN
jgi:Family of unknown function (DUF6338)